MLESYAIWSQITEPGDSVGGLLRRTFGISQSLEYVNSSIQPRELLAKIPEDSFRSDEFIQHLDDSLECWRRRIKTVEPARALEAIYKLDGQLVTPEDPRWPIYLDDLGDHAPAAIWVIGKPESMSMNAISVIGARLASEYGLELTRELVRFSVSQGWSIVSGGALGIDAAASSSAIDNSGTTVAVMAGGLDRLYPRENIGLFQKIKESGALISECAPGVSPSRWRFLQRNRLIAALGHATLVVEAGFRSGSINTAFHANDLGRPVGAMPGPVDSVRSAGCHRLIREGRAELIATPAHLSELMGQRVDLDDVGPIRDNKQIRVLDALYGHVLSEEKVAAATGLTLRETTQTLHLLAKANLVSKISLGWRKH